MPVIRRSDYDRVEIIAVDQFAEVTGLKSFCIDFRGRFGKRKRIDIAKRNGFAVVMLAEGVHQLTAAISNTDESKTKTVVPTGRTNA